ncbi:MAG: hypothetical protein Q4B85_03375 [Lachnospiraceae bacterium]|nr:hypothetical protein [Lachnospiraceae bacterium]
MLASAGVKAPADELPKAAMVHEQVAKRIANVRFTYKPLLESIPGNPSVNCRT